MTDQLTEEEEKTKSLNKLKNKQEAVIADLEGNCPNVIPQATYKCNCIYYVVISLFDLKSAMEIHLLRLI